MPDALNKMVIILEWKNNSHFEASEEFNHHDKTVIVRVEEDGHMIDGWEYIEKILEHAFHRHMKTIHDDMVV